MGLDELLKAGGLNILSAAAVIIVVIIFLRENRIKDTTFANIKTEDRKELLTIIQNNSIALTKLSSVIDEMSKARRRNE